MIWLILYFYVFNHQLNLMNNTYFCILIVYIGYIMRLWPSNNLSFESMVLKWHYNNFIYSLYLKFPTNHQIFGVGSKNFPEIQLVQRTKCQFFWWGVVVPLSNRETHLARMVSRHLVLSTPRSDILKRSNYPANVIKMGNLQSNRQIIKTN